MNGQWLFGTKGTERNTQLDAHLDQLRCTQLGLDHPKVWMYSPQAKKITKGRFHLDDTIPNQMKIRWSPQELSDWKMFLEKSNVSYGVRVPELPLWNQAQCNSEAGRLNEAIELIQEVDPMIANRMARFTPVIIPFISSRKAEGGGFSCQYLKGVSFLSPPKVDPLLNTAINIVHELGHHQLMTYQRSDTLLAGSLTEGKYSVFRNTDRPAILAFHAAVAAGSIVDFLHSLVKTGRFFDNLEPEFNRHLLALKKGIDEFNSNEFTPLGERIYTELKNCHHFAVSVFSSAIGTAHGYPRP